MDSNRDLFSSLEDRVLEIRKGRLYSILCEAWKAEEEERIATKVASEALAERSRHSDISLQTLYDAVFLLKYSEYLPAEGEWSEWVTSSVGEHLLRHRAADQGAQIHPALHRCSLFLRCSSLLVSPL